MTGTARLTSRQRILLAGAAKRPQGKLLSVTRPIAVTEERTRKAIASMLRHGFLVEIEVDDSEPCWRATDETRYGLAITDKGRKAVGFETFYDFQDVDPGQLDRPAPRSRSRRE